MTLKLRASSSFTISGGTWRKAHWPRVSTTTSAPFSFNSSTSSRVMPLQCEVPASNQIQLVRELNSQPLKSYITRAFSQIIGRNSRGEQSTLRSLVYATTLPAVVSAELVLINTQQAHVMLTIRFEAPRVKTMESSDDTKSPYKEGMNVEVSDAHSYLQGLKRIGTR